MSNQLLQKYKRLNDLIRFKATGSPKSLSKKLNISERALYCYLSVLKENGAPIKYTRVRETYYYFESANEFEKVLKFDNAIELDVDRSYNDVEIK